MEKVYYIEKSGKRRIGELITCAVCKKQTISRTRGKTVAKYCSHKCAYIGKQKRIKVTCYTCKKVIFRTPSKIKNSKSGLFFCSRKCKEKAQTLKFGCKEIMPNHYGTSEGRELYKDIIKRRKSPSCQDCGEKRRYLLAIHHKDGDKTNNVKENFEIVCSNCHIKRHLKNIDSNWIYSTRALTPRDLLRNL